MVDAHLDAHFDAHLAHRTTVGVWDRAGSSRKREMWVWIMSKQGGIVHTGPVPQSCAPPTYIWRAISNALLNPERSPLLLSLFPHCHSSINDMLRGWEAGPRTGFIGLLTATPPATVPNSHGREASLPGARFCESEVLTKQHNRGHSWQEACARGTEIVTRENSNSSLLVHLV